MAKVKKTKKRKWRLKKQVRKTLGCLFMISALIVTAIPVQPMEAAPGGAAGWVEDIQADNSIGFKNNWIYSNTTTIPTIKAKGITSFPPGSSCASKSTITAILSISLLLCSPFLSTYAKRKLPVSSWYIGAWGCGRMGGRHSGG